MAEGRVGWASRLPGAVRINQSEATRSWTSDEIAPPDNDLGRRDVASKYNTLRRGQKKPGSALKRGPGARLRCTARQK